jgi:hypothetical protein
MLVTSSLQGVLVAKGGLQQVHQFNPEVKHIHRLSGNQTQVQG